MAALVDRVKARYLPDEAMPDDPAIEEMIQTVTDRLLIRLKVERLPRLAESIAVDAAVKALRLRGYEGSTSESASDAAACRTRSSTTCCPPIRATSRPCATRAAPRASSSWGRADEVVQGQGVQARADGHRRAAQPRLLDRRGVRLLRALRPEPQGSQHRDGERLRQRFALFAHQAPGNRLRDVCGVEVKGASYEVENVMADGDATVVSVKRCKPWAS